MSRLSLFGWIALLSLSCSAPAGMSSAAGTPATGEANDEVAAMTARERAEWQDLVGTILAPCPTVAMSVRECVQRAAPCASCGPASQFLAQHVRRGQSRAQIEAAFRARFDQALVHAIELGNSPSRGAATAPVTIVEWADFQCPFCAQAAKQLEALVAARGTEVRLVFKQYPLPAHPHAEQAARASIAAGQQGKFWEMHAALFAHQSEGLDDAAIAALATELGLDMQRFAGALASEATTQQLAADRAQAEALDLQGTPFIWINGRRFDLKLFDFPDDLTTWLDGELAAARSGGAAK